MNESKRILLASGAVLDVADVKARLQKRRPGIKCDHYTDREWTMIANWEATLSEQQAADMTRRPA